MRLSPAFHRALSVLASPHLLFAALPWMMVVLIVGTVTQPSLGLHEATQRFLLSWLIWIGPMPLPLGGMTAMALITLNLLAKYLFKSEWHWRKSGIHLTHAGVLLLLVGGLVTVISAREGYMIIPEGRTSGEVYAFNQGQINITPPQKPGDRMSWGTPLENLPFTLTLTDFVRENYPGTETPKSYHSDVHVTQGPQKYPVRIAMNEPLRLKGYTIYQSSFLDVGDHQATILQVTHNNGRLFPYIATIMIAAGLILHLIFIRRDKNS